MSQRYLFPPTNIAKHELESGSLFSPVFNESGLITCVIFDALSKDVLMVAYMNAEALSKTLESGEAWYWSRSRKELWHKGETSGQIQTIKTIKVDCDQDSLLIEVIVQGDGGCCHTGNHTCFFRTLDIASDGKIKLR